MDAPELKGNCPVKQQADLDGKALGACPVLIVRDPDRIARYQRAIETGDPTLLAEFAATNLAMLSSLTESELEVLGLEGFTKPQAILGPEGEIIGERPIVNPRAEPVLKALALLGHTAQEQLLTPKSRGEDERDRGLGALSKELGRRAAIAAAGGDR
jgi:hypothetical protein